MTLKSTTVLLSESNLAYIRDSVYRRWKYKPKMSCKLTFVIT